MDKKIEYTNTGPYQLPEEGNGKPGVVADKDKPKIKYCLYARKSSEDDERQTLSIDSQIKEMANQAQDKNLLITAIRKESHSAKTTGQRPVFNQLISDIRSGLFGGILSWSPDRLSRNAGDLGTIVDLMDSGLLQEIRTNGQTFTNSPNDKFLLMILCSQAKLENDHRGENVKRGMRAKCEMGYRPNMTPLGYLNDKLNDKGQKKIYPDPERAPIIKQAFEKVAYKKCSGRQIYLWLKEINFISRSGKPVSLSTVYRILGNPYYTGIFEAPIGSGKWYKGAYESIISKELFKKVQIEMIVPPKSMPGTKTFLYTKLIKCGSCGSGITAQEKVKATGKRYVYYHCTKLKDLSCSEPYTREKNLTEQFIQILGNLTEDQIMMNDKISRLFRQYKRFNSAIIDLDLIEDKANQINVDKIIIEGFVEHVFKVGTREEKRELIRCLKRKLILNKREISCLDNWSK